MSRADDVRGRIGREENHAGCAQFDHVALTPTPPAAAERGFEHFLQPEHRVHDLRLERRRGFHDLAAFAREQIQQVCLKLSRQLVLARLPRHADGESLSLAPNDGSHDCLARFHLIRPKPARGGILRETAEGSQDVTKSVFDICRSHFVKQYRLCPDRQGTRAHSQALFHRSHVETSIYRVSCRPRKCPIHQTHLTFGAENSNNCRSEPITCPRRDVDLSRLLSA